MAAGHRGLEQPDRRSSTATGCSRAPAPRRPTGSSRWPTSGAPSAGRWSSWTATTTPRSCRPSSRPPAAGRAPSSPTPSRARACASSRTGWSGTTRCPRPSSWSSCAGGAGPMSATTTVASTFDCRVTFAEELCALARTEPARSWRSATTRSAPATWSPSPRSSPTGSSTSASPSRTWSAWPPAWPTAASSPSSAAPRRSSPAARWSRSRPTSPTATTRGALRQSPGMAYGELGPTHHSIEDVAWMRAIANLTVIVPADPAADPRRDPLGGLAPASPVYLRIGRFKVPAVLPEGAGLRGRQGDRAAARARTSPWSPPAPWSRARWRRRSSWRRAGSPARVLNIATSSPSTQRRWCVPPRRPGAIVTVEEAYVEGGMGAAVAGAAGPAPPGAHAHPGRHRLRAHRRAPASCSTTSA